MNASTKAFQMSRCKFQSKQQAAENFKLLKFLEETKDPIRSMGQRCDLVRLEVDMQIEQVSLL